MYSQIVLRIHKQIYRYSHVKTSGSSVWSKILNVDSSINTIFIWRSCFLHGTVRLDDYVAADDDYQEWIWDFRCFSTNSEIWGFVDRMTWLKHPWPGPGECRKGDFSTKGSWLLSALESLSCCSLYSPMCLVVSRIVTLLSSYQVLWAKK